MQLWPWVEGSSEWMGVYEEDTSCWDKGSKYLRKGERLGNTPNPRIPWGGTLPGVWGKFAERCVSRSVVRVVFSHALEGSGIFLSALAGVIMGVVQGRSRDCSSLLQKETSYQDRDNVALYCIWGSGLWYTPGSQQTGPKRKTVLLVLTEQQFPWL